MKAFRILAMLILLTPLIVGCQSAATMLPPTATSSLATATPAASLAAAPTETPAPRDTPFLPTAAPAPTITPLPPPPTRQPATHTVCAAGCAYTSIRPRSMAR
jgi:hypothetical protein